MKLKTLNLKNYRNCENIQLKFLAPKTLIIGKNAQGKTNILESIYLLSDLKSTRTSSLLDLIKFNTNGFEINADIEKNNTDIELDFSYNIEKKRQLAINKVKRLSLDIPKEKEQIVMDNFYEEIADVKMCIEQMQMIYG